MSAPALPTRAPSHIRFATPQDVAEAIEHGSSEAAVAAATEALTKIKQAATKRIAELTASAEVIRQQNQGNLGKQAEAVKQTLDRVHAAVELAKWSTEDGRPDLDVVTSATVLEPGIRLLREKATPSKSGPSVAFTGDPHKVIRTIEKFGTVSSTDGPTAKKKHRGHYKCGICGFMPKKEQHSCLEVLAEAAAAAPPVETDEAAAGGSKEKPSSEHGTDQDDEAQERERADTVTRNITAAASSSKADRRKSPFTPPTYPEEALRSPGVKRFSDSPADAGVARTQSQLAARLKSLGKCGRLTTKKKNGTIGTCTKPVLIIQGQESNIVFSSCYMHLTADESIKYAQARHAIIEHRKKRRRLMPEESTCIATNANGTLCMRPATSQWQNKFCCKAHKETSTP